MIQPRAAAGPLWVMCALLGACGGGNPTTGKDMRMVAHDLSTPRDLSVTGDLRGIPDLLPPPTLTGLPTDCTGTITATQLFTDVVQPRCALSNCHAGDTYRYFLASTVAEMMASWINFPYLSINLITPGSLDRSYVLYKLTNQQTSVNKDGGFQMPLGKPVLTHDELCEFIQWVQQGAR